MVKNFSTHSYTGFKLCLIIMNLNSLVDLFSSIYNTCLFTLCLKLKSYMHENNFKIQSNLCTTATLGTWTVAIGQRCLIKLRFRLAVDDSNWPLLTGDRCSQVVVKSGLTVLWKVFFIQKNILTYFGTKVFTWRKMF